MNKCRILFEKTGRAKYISHLDLMRTMQHVFVRAGLRIKHSEGFNPHPRITFAFPLPVCAESDCELMDFELVNDVSAEAVISGLNKVMPEGIRVLSAYTPERKFKEIAWIKISGVMEYDSGVTEELLNSLSEFFNRESIVIEKKSKNKIGDFDIAPCIKSISFSEDNGDVRLDAVVMAQNPGLNPNLLINALKQKAGNLTPDFFEFKRLDLFDSDMNVFK